MSSGQLQRDVKVWLDDHGCSFEGTVDASFDPEIDIETVRWECPVCGRYGEAKV